MYVYSLRLSFVSNVLKVIDLFIFLDDENLIRVAKHEILLDFCKVLHFKINFHSCKHLLKKILFHIIGGSKFP